MEEDNLLNKKNQLDGRKENKTDIMRGHCRPQIQNNNNNNSRGDISRNFFFCIMNNNMAHLNITDK